jgi:hypothetical protein
MAFVHFPAEIFGQKFSDRRSDRGSADLNHSQTIHNAFPMPSQALGNIAAS